MCDLICDITTSFKDAIRVYDKIVIATRKGEKVWK